MPLIPLQLVGDSSIFSQVIEVTTRAQALTLVPQLSPATAGVAAPGLSILRETHAATEFAAASATEGTLTMTGSLPAGAMVTAGIITAVTGFAEDVSCVMIIGTATDPDRYMTGTPSVFATAAVGPQQDGRPSGLAFIRAADTPIITITSAADIAAVIAGAGVATVSIYYIATA